MLLWGARPFFLSADKAKRRSGWLLMATGQPEGVSSDLPKAGARRLESSAPRFCNPYLLGSHRLEANTRGKACTPQLTFGGKC
jgi:hypothetical protein